MRKSARQPTILMYHAVAEAEEDPNLLCVPPSLFEAQMDYLRGRGLRGVSVRELLHAPDPRGLVGLTFDDGYEDFLRTAVPVMEGHGFTATVFAVAGRLGGENDWEHSFDPRPPMRLMDPDGLREAAERGMEVGAHTMTHPHLPRISPERLDEEVAGSKEALQEIVGGEIGGFCYPYGDLDLRAIRAARRADFDYACAWKTRITNDACDLFRTPVDRRDGMLRFGTKLRIYPQYARVTAAIR